MDVLTTNATMNEPRLKVAVLIPCLNEAAGIASVVDGFKSALPDATIYVYDNASSDDTSAVAERAGAKVRREPMRGKGNVVRRMFADVDADVYVLVDGDGTYDAASAPAMIELLAEQHLDMVCGKRVDSDVQAYRHGHRLGNRVLTGLVAVLFGDRITDILSGYRVMSRRFVKSFPALSSGFETETELTVHALDLRVPIAEVPHSLWCAFGWNRQQAQYLARWLADPAHHRPSREGRTAVRVLRIHRQHSRADGDSPGDSAAARIPCDRTRTAHSDRRAFHRSDARGGHEFRLRTGTRHRDARAARTQAHALPAARQPYQQG